MTDRDDWPVHQPEALDAPIPGRHWYSGCEPGGDFDPETLTYEGTGPRVDPATGRCEGCGAFACRECGREACPDHASVPASIVLYESESRWMEVEDFGYVDCLAQSLAEALRSGACAECVYQPGDGTRYPLVLVALRHLVTAEPKYALERHALPGMMSGRLTYDPTGYLVVWVGHSAYPLRLGAERGTLAASYIQEHWTDSDTSAVSLAVLLRSVSHHLGST